MKTTLLITESQKRMILKESIVDNIRKSIEEGYDYTTKVLSEVNNQVQLKWLIEAYSLFPEKEKFFILPKSGKMEESFFNKLAGNDLLWRQLKDGVSETDIRKSWEPQLEAFKKIRKKYLLYPDFDESDRTKSR